VKIQGPKILARSRKNSNSIRHLTKLEAIIKGAKGLRGQDGSGTLFEVCAQPKMRNDRSKLKGIMRLEGFALLELWIVEITE